MYGVSIHNELGTGKVTKKKLFSLEEKNMKKTVAIILSAMMLIAVLAACGTKNVEDSEEPATSPTTSEKVEESTSPDVTESETPDTSESETPAADESVTPSTDEGTDATSNS